MPELQPDDDVRRQQRMHQLHPSARFIYAKVVCMLDEAEKPGGPEGQAFLSLMRAIIDETAYRLDRYRKSGADRRGSGPLGVSRD